MTNRYWLRRVSWKCIMDWLPGRKGHADWMTRDRPPSVETVLLCRYRTCIAWQRFFREPFAAHLLEQERDVAICFRGAKHGNRWMTRSGFSTGDVFFARIFRWKCSRRTATAWLVGQCKSREKLPQCKTARPIHLPHGYKAWRPLLAVPGRLGCLPVPSAVAA